MSAHWRKSSISPAVGRPARPVVRRRQRFRIRIRSRQADGLNLGEVDYLTVEPSVAVPARHTRLSELLNSVLPQLGEVYEGFAMRLDDARGSVTVSPNPADSADRQACVWNSTIPFKGSTTSVPWHRTQVRRVSQSRPRW